MINLKLTDSFSSKDVTLKRTFTKDGFTLECEVNGVKATRHYTRVNK